MGPFANSRPATAALAAASAGVVGVNLAGVYAFSSAHLAGAPSWAHYGAGAAVALYLGFLAFIGAAIARGGGGGGGGGEGGGGGGGGGGGCYNAGGPDWAAAPAAPALIAADGGGEGGEGDALRAPLLAPAGSGSDGGGAAGAGEP